VSQQIYHSNKAMTFSAEIFISELSDHLGNNNYGLIFLQRKDLIHFKYPPGCNFNLQLVVKIALFVNSALFPSSNQFYNFCLLQRVSQHLKSCQKLVSAAAMRIYLLS
jgi:hypothetical protein